MNTRILLMLIGAFFVSLVNATDLTSWKLVGKWSTYAAGFNLGDRALASNDRWVIAGAQHASEGATNWGAVQVFSATTGAWLRTLHSPGVATADRGFGYTCALAGNLAIVSESIAPGKIGAVQVFDLTSGKLVRTLHAPPADDVSGNYFGTAFAVSGSRLFVSAPGLGNGGSVYLFDLKTWLIQKTYPAPGYFYFGASLAVEADRLLVGAIGANSIGAGYLYDVTTGQLIRKYQPATAQAGDNVGDVVAMQGGKAVLGTYFTSANPRHIYVIDIATDTTTILSSGEEANSDLFGSALALEAGLLAVGAPGHASNNGAVYLFDLHSGSNQPFKKILPVEPAAQWGSVMAFYGSTLVFGASTDDASDPDSGAIIMVRSVTRRSEYGVVAAKGDYAPGRGEIRYNAIGDAWINPDGEVGFISSLSGLGSNGGKDSALFSTIGSNGNYLARMVGSRDYSSNLGGTVTAMKKLIMARGDRFLMSYGLSPTDSAIGSGDGLSLIEQESTKSTFGHWCTGLPAMVQCRGMDAMAYVYTLKAGLWSATPSSDSGARITMIQSAGYNDLWESSSAPGTTVNFGQFAPRVAAYYKRMICSCALTSTAIDNAAIYQAQINGTTELVARKNDPAANAGGAKFSTFIGESGDVFDLVLYRATLGAPATTANNEGLWLRSIGGTHTLVMRKGDPVPGLTGVMIAKFINFWEVDGQTMALVQLKGAGVTSANDQALLLYQPFAPFSGAIAVLMREGDPAPGCGTATIGVINRVEVDPLYGHYLVLATLAGAPVGTELALFRGFSFALANAVSDQALRRPTLLLRKGQLFDNQPSPLKSISLPTGDLTASGAGNVGLGSSMQEPTSNSTPSRIVIAIDYANGVHQVIMGIP